MQNPCQKFAHVDKPKLMSMSIQPFTLPATDLAILETFFSAVSAQPGVSFTIRCCIHNWEQRNLIRNPVWELMSKMFS
ncbi:hypothetical protein Mapa_016287 [Marchantia paleacea]|nr:hypothetical protein Mapa_016287 [Marchantia paleacea]